MASTIGRATQIVYGGLEQFPVRSHYGEIEYCIAESKPYALEFANDSDVICLLLGDIVSSSRFEDDREKPLVFECETAAYHPRQGNVRVSANTVRHGFIAFSYSNEFQAAVSEQNLHALQKGGSINNIRSGAIAHLSRFAREIIRSRGALDALQIQYLGGMVYLETMDTLLSAREDSGGLSDPSFRKLVEFVDAELEHDISCEGLARAINVPLRRVFDGIKQRTGLTPYQFVINKRVDRALHLLEHSEHSISEIALSCGFASQQHMTATLSKRLGSTPNRLRKH
jgi:AraC family transcriptional regulator